MTRRASTDSEPSACQPPPESACSARGARTPRQTATPTQVSATVRRWVAAHRPRRPSRPSGAVRIMDVDVCARVFKRALLGGRRRASSVVEGGGSVGGELHQRGGALELGVLDEVAFVQVALVEADRAHVEATALLDELLVHELYGGLPVVADRVDVAAQREAHALAGEPHHDLLALVEGGAGGEVGDDHAIGILLAVGAADDHASVASHVYRSFRARSETLLTPYLALALRARLEMNSYGFRLTSWRRRP